MKFDGSGKRSLRCGEGMKERNEGFYGPDYLSNVLSLRSIHISKASHLSLSLSF